MDFSIDYNTPSPTPLTTYEKETPAEQLKCELTPEEAYDIQRDRWLSLQTALRENLNRDKDSRYVTNLQEEIARMISNGFTYKPKPEPVKAVPAPAPAPKPFEQASLREELGVPEKVSCENCGENIVPGNASHLRDLDGETCILDEARIKRSGRFTKERLAELVALTESVRKNLKKENGN